MSEALSSTYTTAFEHFNGYRNMLKMTTGSANLDSLTDGIQEGQCYLFYGNNKAILEGLVHGLLVNCILPTQKHGVESMALYINNVDYYQADKSKVLSPERIAVAAKWARIEPKIVFKNLFVRIAYNQKHQLEVAKQVSDFIDGEQDIRLLIVNNLTKFFKWAKHKDSAAGILKEVLGILCKLCARNRIALICTGHCDITSRGVIPRPVGGTFLKHAMNVIVYLQESSFHQSFKVTLIKHQYSNTPSSVFLNTVKTGRMLLLDGS